MYFTYINRMSIKSKLLIALSVILVVAFVATSMINYMVTRDSVRDELLNSSLPLTGKNIYSEIHASMMRPVLVASSMGSDTFLRDWIEEGEEDTEKIKRYLAAIKSEYNFLTAFFVSASSDKYYYPNGVLKTVNPRDARDVWYYSFIQTGKKYDLNVDPSQADRNTLTIFVNQRVEDENGKLIGVVGVGMNMDRAIGMLLKAREQYGRSVYLVDQDGRVQVHPDKSLIEKSYITETDGIESVAESILVKRDVATNFEYDQADRHILLSTRYIPEFEWHLIVEQDEGQALLAARNNLIRTLAVGFASSLLIILLCVLTINHFQARLEHMAKTDPLTGVANRRALDERFLVSAYKADRYKEPFSIIIFDLDKFKDINDMQGHLAGDIVLKAVADTIANTIRPTDLIARWGGDEFIVLMDGTRNDAEALVTRIRAAMTHSSQETLISFSCGITEFEEADDIGSITHRADQAMYRAKAKGGDCVICG